MGNKRFAGRSVLRCSYYSNAARCGHSQRRYKKQYFHLAPKRRCHCQTYQRSSVIITTTVNSKAYRQQTAQATSRLRCSRNPARTECRIIMSPGTAADHGCTDGLTLMFFHVARICPRHEHRSSSVEYYSLLFRNFVRMYSKAQKLSSCHFNKSIRYFSHCCVR